MEKYYFKIYAAKEEVDSIFYHNLKNYIKDISIIKCKKEMIDSGLLIISGSFDTAISIINESIFNNNLTEEINNMAQDFYSKRSNEVHYEFYYGAFIQVYRNKYAPLFNINEYLYWDCDNENRDRAGKIE